jgi:GNAT superfamily N-acetyltransferase
LVELPPDRFGAVRSLISRARVPAQAVLAGRAPGRVFVNDARQPTAAFVWDEFRFCYLAGDSNDSAFVTGLADLMANELLPAARSSHDPTVVLDPDAPGWFDHLDQLMPGVWRVRALRQTFTFDPACFAWRDRTDRIPEGMRVEPIAGHLAREIVNPLVGILWRSVDDFLSDGVGFCVLADDTIASTCLSAFIARQRVEISIDTHPDYRRQGLATLCGAAFVAYCLEHHLEPVWECWNNNVPSIQLGSKLGFQKDAERTTCFLDLSRPAGQQNSA